MSEPSMKQFWAGMAMFALILKSMDADPEEVAIEAWRFADSMETEERDKD